MQKNTLITAVAASLLALPASQAAIDDAGMQYTSAAEGFYGSLRVGFQSVSQDNKDETGIDQLSSRLGVRGTADLGGGLTASYRYEFGVDGDDGSRTRTISGVTQDSGDDAGDPATTTDTGIGNTRLQNVGLSGGFGSLLIGTQWALDYNYVWGTTDVMNLFGGNHAYNANRAGRQSNAITYTSPDFNGFSFGASAAVDNAKKSITVIGLRNVDVTTTVNTTLSMVDLGTTDVLQPDARIVNGGTVYVPYEEIIDRGERAPLTVTVEDEPVTVDASSVEGFANAVATANNDASDADAIDKIVFAAGYSRAGLDIGGTYVRRAITSRTVTGVDLQGTENDSVTVVDQEINPTTFGLAFGYGQDNWSLDYWYGRTDLDMDDLEEKLHSLAGQLGVGKATMRAIWERKTLEDGSGDTDVDFVTLGVQYDLGSRARVFAEYDNRDSDENSDDRDRFLVGYRVDF